MQPDPAFRPRQPRLDELRVMVAGIVQEDVELPLIRKHRLDRHQQHDRACSVHRQHVLHDGLAGLEVDRAVDVQSVPAASLLHRDGDVFWRPAANRPHRAGRMHRVREDDSFIVEHPVHQSVVFLDEGRLLRRIQLARDRFGLAVFHLQAMQQRDQPGPGLVFNAVFTRNPCAHFAGGAGQGCGDPDFQLVLSRGCQPAGAALMAEVRQAFDAVFLIVPAPRPDRVVVNEQNPGGGLAGHAVIQKQNRVGPARQTVRSRPVTGQLDQVFTRFGVEEAGADHGRTRIAAELIRKGIFRVPAESGYICPPLRHGAWLSPPLILRTSVWRKERIRKGRNLAETNPGGPRRVHLLLSRPAGPRSNSSSGRTSNTVTSPSRSRAVRSLMDLKRGVDKAVTALVAELEKRSKKITTQAETAQVGTIAANGEVEIGQMIAEAMQKVGNEGVITVEEAKGIQTELDVVEGMQFDRGYMSPYFITNAEKMNVVLDNPYILLFEKKLSALQSFLPLLEAVAQSTRPLLIIAEDVEGEALATLVVNKLRGGLKVAAVKAPGFGDRRKAMLEDIAVLTKGEL